MDQQYTNARGRSPSAASTGGVQVHDQQQQQQSHIRNHSPSPAPFPNSNDGVNTGLGLGLIDPSASQPFQPEFSYGGPNPFQQNSPFSQPGLDFNQGYTNPLESQDNSFSGLSQAAYSPNLMASNFGNQDFSLFPTTTTGGQFNGSLYITDNQSLNNSDPNMMAQGSHSPEPPHLLSPEMNSPAFAQGRFPMTAGRHSRNASLGPEAALLPGQDWSHMPQFQGHRRSASELSDVSSVAHSPNLGGLDSFDPIENSHSPLQGPQADALFNQLNGIKNFSLDDHIGRSPSHSPAVSPRIPPQQSPDENDPNHPNHFMLHTPANSFGPPATYMQPPQQEAFPQLALDDPSGMQAQQPMPAPPAINIDFAPAPVKNGLDQPNNLDNNSLGLPRVRGRMRPRAVTDPFNNGSYRSASASGGLSPHSAADLRPSSARSLSPMDRSGAGSINSRRRQSTSSVPNNVIALRLADPNYNGSGENGGGPRRAQKHPATFQCKVCPKRFTRAYNLRSHLRTHTDERPFKCTVCDKAFARQHDRKRHEGLHSGEKKFICKGELPLVGQQWGCGRRFARADALGRHFRSEAGRICIRPLLEAENRERQRQCAEAMQNAAQGQMQYQGGMMMPPGMDPNGEYQMDQFVLPQALLAQYPALALLPAGPASIGDGAGLDEDLGSNYEASDYDDVDEGGYVSGPGTGFGPGSMQEGYGELGYASDFGGR
ncbi:hypothetical protein SMACR_08565 [Sordaria macrospora]|uniref:WGS project CABT00000000 data, contig 2.2 n=2 Tax=Sordaria macrospora TaxID=5147 RepID=F7VMK3_SORMK|nr:uncharacterized protein SMAC_08565 [Sordaria macrospora k-hell]KAA8633116.1 hypothetical protein SMACR_08565 [Sordaria macrospora]WPJ62444.1 hypothetical protein SMAC4_08565 [Sordaria macrospora]CCC07184.1 unnamed protein product [Sordaria macrospora k-hell]